MGEISPRKKEVSPQRATYPLARKHPLALSSPSCEAHRRTSGVKPSLVGLFQQPRMRTLQERRQPCPVGIDIPQNGQSAWGVNPLKSLLAHPRFATIGASRETYFVKLSGASKRRPLILRKRRIHE